MLSLNQFNIVKISVNANLSRFLPIEEFFLIRGSCLPHILFGGIGLTFLPFCDYLKFLLSKASVKSAIQITFN